MDIKILVDIDIILDALSSRDKISKQLIDKLTQSQYELFITSSMIPLLDYLLRKSNINKRDFKEFLLSRFKIITSTGYEAIESMDFEDSAEALISISFKRIAPDGMILSRNKNFKRYGLKVLTPEELLTNINLNDNESKKISFLNLQKQYRYLMEYIDHTVLTEIAEAKYILGPKVKDFEQALANYIGTNHAIGAASGTDALLLSLRALAIKRKDKEYWDKEDLIITTPFTFTATGDTILRAGATPLFVDIDLTTYNIDPAKIKEALKFYGKRVIGIVPVHLYGLPCYMDEILEIAQEHNLFVVEDCAQAFGSRYKDKKVGSFGDTGCFSFFPSKNLGAFGDAGAVTTNDDELADIIKMLRVHGGKDKYNVEHIGYKARLDTLQAAILLAKFECIDELNERRRKIAKIYNESLKDIDWMVLPEEIDKAYHVYHQYTVRIKDRSRNNVQKILKEEGIETMVYYPVPLHRMRVFINNGVEVFDTLKNAELASESVLSLPMEPLMNKEVINEIVEALSKV